MTKIWTSCRNMVWYNAIPQQQAWNSLLMRLSHGAADGSKLTVVYCLLEYM